jgi:hypothetical protein
MIAGDSENILCPCKDYRNLSYVHTEIVFEHLVVWGMDSTYTTWFHHGEQLTNNEKQNDGGDSEIFNLYKAAHAQDADSGEQVEEILYNDFSNFLEEVEAPHVEERSDDMISFLEEAEKPLYPGYKKYVKLLAILVLYKHKVMNRWSDNSFNGLLGILRDMLPEGNVIPDSMSSARKLVKAFDNEYEKIHACKNDCCLFRKENEGAETCPKCGSSRWQVDKQTQKVRKGIPAKVLRYFPIIPRFKRMFGSFEMSKHFRWHFTNKSEDGNMRHPVDSLAWEMIDKKWPSFSIEPRNLRLGLAIDGFNPFRALSSKYSCWPVMLVMYNLPPWLCMRRENIMLALLIPGPKQPGNDIDVFLQPLIEDLQELWNRGTNAYDAFTKSYFNLKAILMWTINDFPAYGNLAGCTTKGRKACPICAENTCSQWLTHSKKFSYMGHRRFLRPHHPYRTKKKWFDGNDESRGKPRILTGSEILLFLQDFQNDWGKYSKSKRKKDNDSVYMWKKRSIFFELSYWKVRISLNFNVIFIIKEY